MSHRKLLYRLGVFLALGILAGCGGSVSSGDRVLVSKCEYDTGLKHPERHQVVVFKYPQGPVERNIPKNYIKRLWGLPGEILAIFFGRIYHFPAPAPGQPPIFNDLEPTAKAGEGPVEPADAHDLWQKKWMHVDENKDLFEKGQFEILRKPPPLMMALRRIVYDNDFQAKDLVGKIQPRWEPAPTSDWKNDQPHTFAHKGGDAAAIDWLRYQHRLRPGGPLRGGEVVPPQLITDVMGYNSYEVAFNDRDFDRKEGEGIDRTPQIHNWVGDLMLEAQVDVQEPRGEFLLELSKGPSRFQVRFDLTNGMCALHRITGDQDEELAKQQTRVKAPGSYLIRFANFDARLTVWVDRDLPFGDGHDYPPPEVRGKGEENLPEEELLKRRGPTANDLQPASLGSKGAHVKVSHLRLWRDTYYTTLPMRGDASAPPESWSDPSKWEGLRRPNLLTMYVQPGHYLVLGDNSPFSADSRQWGTVPDRLMLGRALFVYFPLGRAGPIR